MATEQTHEWGDDRAGSCPVCHRELAAVRLSGDADYTTWSVWA